MKPITYTIIGIVLIITSVYLFTFIFDTHVYQDKVLDENTGKYTIKYKEGSNPLWVLGIAFIWLGTGFLTTGVCKRYIMNENWS